MQTRLSTLITRLRRPEYTGENRCTPCTVVNVGIALAASALVALAAPWLALPVLGASLAAIALRGYLVPGTPALTERYLPDPVLRWFEERKGTAPEEIDATPLGAGGEGEAGREELDAEPILLDAGVLEPLPDGGDLRLTAAFEAAWDDQLDAVREEGYEPRLARLLHADDAADPAAIEVTVEGDGDDTGDGNVIEDGTVTVAHDGDPVALWPSEAALAADLAAAPLLRERLPGWADLDVPLQGQLLHSVRLFLERCPACDGDLVLSEETVRSCCRTAEVATLACDDCGATVLEVGI